MKTQNPSWLLELTVTIITINCGCYVVLKGLFKVLNLTLWILQKHCKHLIMFNMWISGLYNVHVLNISLKHVCVACFVSQLWRHRPSLLSYQHRPGQLCPLRATTDAGLCIHAVARQWPDQHGSQCGTILSATNTDIHKRRQTRKHWVCSSQWWSAGGN